MASLVERFARTLLLILLLSRVPKFIIVQTNYEGSRNPRNPYEQTAQSRTLTPQTHLGFYVLAFLSFLRIP